MAKGCVDAPSRTYMRLYGAKTNFREVCLGRKKSVKCATPKQLELERTCRYVRIRLQGARIPAAFRA
jgi:hypothetical protein